MKYVAPYGSGDPNAPYVNGNPSTGVQGSIPPAAAFEHPLREIVAAIAGAGLTPDENVLNQLAYAIQKGMNYSVATGTANAWVVGLSLAPLAYAAGLSFDIIAPATNTSTTVNANIAGLGNRRLKKRDGSDPAIGDLVSGVAYTTIDDGTNIRILSMLPSDIGAALTSEGGRILNYRVYKTTARSVLSGAFNPGIVLWSQTYPKLKASTKLIFEALPSLRLADTSSTTYARARLNGSSGTDQYQNHYLLYNNGGVSFQSPQANKYSWDGIAAGDVAIEYRVGQALTNVSTVVVNPSSTDGSGWVDGFSSTFTVYEVEN